MSTRLIAYYLPQFHRIPENDAWWGEGFTEWTNVRRAQPLFDGHAQPRRPTDLGYYDLADPLPVLQKQADLARAHGIHGFCYYWYWFADGRRLLERPLEAMLASSTPDFPFCLCWANENWSRRWDGGEHEVLMPQDHGRANNLACLRAMVPYLLDPRYMRVDGRPLLLLYRAELLAADPAAVAAEIAAWRDELRAAGVGEVHLVCVQSFAAKNPLAFGFDAACEFPPHQLNARPQAPAPLPGTAFEGRVFDYREAMANALAAPAKPWRQYRGVMTGWDNTPRRRARGTVFANSSPQAYQYWLAKAVEATVRDCPPSQRLVFINAWNEWAEGAYLEPDDRHDDALLRATRDALAAGEGAARPGVVDALVQRFAAWMPTPGRWNASRAGCAAARRVKIGHVVCAFGPAADAGALGLTLDALAGAGAQPDEVLLLTADAAADRDGPASALATASAASMHEAGTRALQAAAARGWTHLVFHAPGDALLPHAIDALAWRAAQPDAPAFVYGDELTCLSDPDQAFTQFKPDFNLDLLRSLNYVGGPLAIAVDLFAASGGFTAGSDGAEDHALLLSAMARDPGVGIAHVPQLLGLRAQAWRPGAQRPAEQVMAVSRAALEAHWQALDVPAAVEPGPLPGSHVSRIPLLAQPYVSIVLPLRDRLPLLERCLTTLLAHTRDLRFELLLVDNASREPQTGRFLDGLRALGDDRIRVLDWPRPFSLASVMNFAAAQARGDHLLLLHSDCAVLHDGWLQALLAHAQRPDIGAVGPRLLGPDGDIDSAGVVLGLGGAAAQLHGGMPPSLPGLNGRLQLDYNPAALSGACLLTPKAVFDEIGGFDERTFADGDAEVDYALRLGQAGWRLLWTPQVTLLHEGVAERAAAEAERSLDPARARERRAQRALPLWRAHLRRLAHDPAYNPNLTLDDASGVQATDCDALWPLAAHDRPRIAGTAADDFGSGNYRVRQPLAALQAAGRADTRTLRSGLSPLLAARFEVDVLLLQRPFTDEWLAALKRLRDLGCGARVIELDDLITDVPRDSAYARGIPTDIGRLVRRAFDLADRIVVSTAPLADAYAKLHHDIRVVPNRLPAAWRALVEARAPHRGGRPRIGWAGGIGHEGDLRLLVDVVEALAGECDWVFLGAVPAALRRHAAEQHVGVPFDIYPQTLAALGLDVALAPLAANRFNECKSNLRLLEYGALGVPVVATDIAPYRCGLPVTLVRNRPAAWIEAIRSIAFAPDAARQAGEALRAAVLRDWMLDPHLDAWVGALLDSGSEQPATVTGRAAATVAALT